MKITLFTSSDVRHNYLINLLAKSCEKLMVVQEYKSSKFKNQRFNISKITQDYFNQVNDAQFKIFGEERNIKSSKNLNIISIPNKTLNNLSLSFLNDFLKSDLYIVYGSSFIKGNLIEFLIKEKAINIHAGISPYYRGTDCNFWALFDNNPHLVGSTIHLLSTGLDNGDLLYHAMSKIKDNPFNYTMSTVKSAFHSIYEKIKNRSIFDLVPINQDKNKEIRFSRKIDFNEDVIKKYLNKKIDLQSRDFDKALLKDPYFLEK